MRVRRSQIKITRDVSSERDNEDGQAHKRELYENDVCCYLL